MIPRQVLAAPGRPGANERILTGVIGCGGRSAVLLNQSPGDFQIVALADCDLRQMGPESAFGQSVAGPFSDDFGKWRRYQDYREMVFSTVAGRPRRVDRSRSRHRRRRFRLTLRVRELLPVSR